MTSAKKLSANMVAALAVLDAGRTWFHLSNAPGVPIRAFDAIEARGYAKRRFTAASVVSRRLGDRYKITADGIVALREHLKAAEQAKAGFVIATTEWEKRIDADSWGAAVLLAQKDAKVDGIFGIRSPKGASRFFKKRNGAVYPISADAANRELLMRGSS